MKKINKLAVVLSGVALVVLFSLLSMVAAPAETRYTWTGLNPWNGVKGVNLTLRRFLDLDTNVISFLTLLVILAIAWRIYVLISRLIKR